MADTSTAQDSYLAGAGTKDAIQIAYLIGGSSVTDDAPCFLTGNILSIDSVGSYTYGENTDLSAQWAYLIGVFRGSVDAYLEGQNTGDDSVANDYIILRSSNSSIDKKFKVLAQDYDDGTLEKAQSAKRTLGGGISMSLGGIYQSWNPMIRVRHTETQSGYGDLQDLIDLYSLNNPNGTPSNQITFIDHHNVSRVVLIVGDLRKSVMGSEIEGEEAWSFVSVQLQELPNA